MLEIHVTGQPIPQGSKTAAVIGGRAVMFDSNKKLKEWRATVTAATRTELIKQRFNGFESDQPLVVFVEFHLERPKTVKRLFPAVKPDLDKLVRAVFDGVTDGHAWHDDSQVISVYATKMYSTTPGALIRIYNKSVTDEDTLRKSLRNG
jgi:Holliday junction resolvase RusA-like endonuclease